MTTTQVLNDNNSHMLVEENADIQNLCKDLRKQLEASAALKKSGKMPEDDGGTNAAGFFSPTKTAQQRHNDRLAKGSYRRGSLAISMRSRKAKPDAEGGIVRASSQAWASQPVPSTRPRPGTLPEDLRPLARTCFASSFGLPPFVARPAPGLCSPALWPARSASARRAFGD